MLEGDFVLGEPRPDGDAVLVPVDVPVDLKFLDGHFPGNPVVPGVAQLMLVERAARAVWPDLPGSAGLERLKFRARIDPGDRVVVRLERVGSKVRFGIDRDARACTTGTLRLADR